jgi:RND family efflux transporter MFP subunit
MNYRAGIVTGAFAALLLVGTGVLAWRLVIAPPHQEAKSAAPSPPAKVSKVAKEDDFATVTLTPQAEQRLKLRTAAVEKKPMPRVRVLGGEVMIPPGGSLIVSAPLAGTLAPPSQGEMPGAGITVKKGEVVLQLSPLLSPEAKATLAASRVDADGQVKSAQTQVDAAKIALDRARRLLREQAGSRRDVDEKQEKYDLAQRSLEAARARRNLLVKVVGDLEKGTVAPLPICAPEGGMLRTVSALPGQTVPSGAALFEVIDPARVWLRVAVYVGDLPGLAPAAEVGVGNLADPPDRPPSRTAQPVQQAPPAANPLAATVDLFYRLDNSDVRLRPGQRVAVHVPLKKEKEGLVVPWSAVIHDYHGGTWVYENVAPHVYTRRRVVVRHVNRNLAVLDSGPPPGTKVVVDGAIELFGTEVGFAK